MTHVGIGICNNGGYAGNYHPHWDVKGLDSQAACNAVCLSESKCTFSAWNPGKSCHRFKGRKCDLDKWRKEFDWMKEYTVYKKQRGNFQFFSDLITCIVKNFQFAYSIIN